jgi:hypothetical protein
MSELKMIIVPSETETRLQAKDASGRLKLHGTLPTAAEHTLALPRLLSAIGSFLPVRAALVVPSRAPSYATRLYPDWWLVDGGGDGYELQIIGSARRERREWWGR